ncbi:MAG TPA: ABC transporter permease [Bacteroidota bacterium]|nr:ABC transporter permease [Bacteroidota bacterium]
MALQQQEAFDLVIEAGRTERHYWKDLWRYRELFFFLAWRDTLVRYKQTVIGIAWALLRPLLTMLIFTVVFGRLAKLPSEGNAPYTILVFAATLPWQFFSTALSEASLSLIGNTNLISKVYFPRLIVPSSTIITCFIDFLISGFILIGMMIWYGFVPSWNIVFIPLLIILTIAASLGLGFFLSAVSVRYRDFKYIVPFIIQFGLYVSPVGYSSAIIPDKWRILYSLNPMVGVIDGFRWSIIGGSAFFNLISFCISASVVVILLLVGVIYFRKTEKKFADII